MDIITLLVDQVGKRLADNGVLVGLHANPMTWPDVKLTVKHGPAIFHIVMPFASPAGNLLDNTVELILDRVAPPIKPPPAVTAAHVAVGSAPPGDPDWAFLETL